MLFDQDHIHPHIYVIPTLGPHMDSIHNCSMRIKVTSLVILHQQRGMGYRKKREEWENKRTKNSSTQERERMRKRK
jgi:hypothetical protein